jgi:hypothetical protein
MELRCPNCGGRELRKVSVVSGEGRYHARSRTRLRGLLLGADGPDFVLGKADTVGVFQSELSKKLQPPGKWSYLKLAAWIALGTLIALVSCVLWVMSRSTNASPLPVALFLLVVALLFLVLASLVWRHNRCEYPRRYAEWERSFLCRGCGGIESDGLLGGES